MSTPEITDLRWAVDSDGTAHLAFTLLGRPARAYRESQKESLNAAGLVHVLGVDGGFEDLLPPVAFTPRGSRQVHRLRGFIRDPALVRALARLAADKAAGTFAPGPIPAR